MELFEQYYLSDDPSDLGNFINGRLSFDDEDDSNDERDDPGLLDHRAASSASLHSMDDDLRDGIDGVEKANNGKRERSKSTIRLHEKAGLFCEEAKGRCCVTS